MNVSFFIARRNLLKQKGRFSSFIIRLAAVATALSVAVMILSIAVVTGFKHTIKEKLYGFLGHVHIELYDESHSNSLSSAPIKQDVALMETVKRMPHVTSIYPFAQRPVIIQAHGQMEGVNLKGVEQDFHFSNAVSLTGKAINFTDSGYSKNVILSTTTANLLNIQAGDTVMLYFLESGAAFPRIRKVIVAGLFHTGMEELDKSYGICDVRMLQRINNWQADDINGYQVQLDYEKYADTTANIIFDKYLHPPLTTYTIKDLYPSIFDWLELQNLDTQIILIIMAVVAIINLATALVILIVEQARMVGLLKALGMTYGKIEGIFLYHASIIAFTGIVAGNILALGVCWLQQKTGFMKLREDTYFMKYVPMRLYWWQVALTDVATLVLCILCMWLPALYIRRIRPARVLQFK